jgi:hypothetical protein
MASEKVTVPFCSVDCAKLGQSPAILLDALNLEAVGAFLRPFLAFDLLRYYFRGTSHTYAEGP